MSNQTAFQPMGKTYVCVGNGAVSAVVSVVADSPVNQYDFYNSGPGFAFIRICSSAANTAVQPTAAAPNYGWGIDSGQRVIRGGWQSGLQSNVTISVCTSGANILATVYITPGEGM